MAVDYERFMQVVEEMNDIRDSLPEMSEEEFEDWYDDMQERYSDEEINAWARASMEISEPISVSFQVTKRELGDAGIPYGALEQLVESGKLRYCRSCESVWMADVPTDRFGEERHTICPVCGYGVHVKFVTTVGTIQDHAQDLREKLGPMAELIDESTVPSEPNIEKPPKWSPKAFEEGDELLWGDRKQALTVTSIEDGVVWVEGPRGGEYSLEYQGNGKYRADGVGVVTPRPAGSGGEK